MSRVVEHNDTFTGNPTSYDPNNSSYASVSSSYPISNGYDDENSNNYAYITCNNGRNVSTYISYTFNVTGIPQNAEITNVVCSVKSRMRRNYMQTANIQLYASSVAKGTSTSFLSTTATARSVNGGSNWSLSEIQNIQIRSTAVRGTSNQNSVEYIYFYGATLTIDYTWYETFYSISTSSNVQGVSISSTSDETLEGGSNTITLSNVSDISTVIIKDNGNDITSLFTRSGSNYVYTLTNINADHTIIVEDNSSSSSKKSYVKKNNAFVESTNQYVKESNSWVSRTISKIFWKINGNWTETNDSMSGKTAFKVDV